MNAKCNSSLPRCAAMVLPLAALVVSQPLLAQTGPEVAIQPSGTNRVQVTWPSGTNFNVLQRIPALTPTNAWLDVPDAPSVFGARYGIYRDATNSASFYRLATRGTLGQATPPDPASNAPPLVPNTFNDLGSSTAFLYTGSNAVQIGVAPGTIAPTRAAVVRGKVMKRDKSPLPGVRVFVLNHPEYGYTFTRQDGMFDLALNGGLYTVDFQAIGYCPAQRQVEAPFQDFRTVPDVALVPLDPVATPVSFSPSAPPQMAAGSPQTDDDGTRTTRVFLPAGTTASVLMPDGSARPVSSLTLRLTEYTVGTNGQAAMPAPLPPTSAYTFCAEFSADEAMNVGAKSIQFNQPVWGYVENFLDIPVGMMVPNGYYDRDQSAWVPSQNGIVVKILGVTNGLAQVDLTGSNVVADATTLAAVSFSTAELQQLASTYSPGQSVWRVPLNHFTAWDWNYALGVLPPKSPNRPGDKAKTDPCPPGGGGGTVNVGAQVFQESIPLVGAPMALHYSSARVPDYRAEAKAEVAVLSFPFRPDVLGVQAQYEVAGQYTDEEVGMVENVTLSWDGYDAYGRYVGGTRQASGRIVIELGMIYGGNGWGYDTRLNHPLFTSYGQTTFAAGHGGGRGIGIGASFTRMLTIPDHRTIGLGGWSLTPHHSYDPAGHFLYLGTGKLLKQDRFANGIGPVPGLSGVPHFMFARKVAAGADGTVYFEAYFDDAYTTRICKLGADGQFAYVTGNSYTPGVVYVDGAGYAAVDGQSALKAVFGSVTDMTVGGPDGSLYVRNTYTIARIDPQGILHKVLGDGGPYPYIYPPDGSPAGHAMTQPTSAGCIAVGLDGAVYYDDFWNLGGINRYFIRKVAPDGRIYTVAGQGGTLVSSGQWRTQVGVKADAAQLYLVSALAAGPDGTLYISPYVAGQYAIGGVYKITPDGVLGMVMNWVPFPSVGYEPMGDDGANAATFVNSWYSTIQGPNRLQVAPDGSLAFAQGYGNGPPALWRITPGGILQRLAGRGPYSTVSPPYSPFRQGANPLQVAFGGALDFAVSPDGSLTLNDGSYSASFRISASASGFTGQELQIPADDGSELYVFDAHGLHLRTLNGLTGATNWSFSYDANNLVTQLRNGNGLTTTVERNSGGQPTAIVGPYGQRTTLALDANGFLAGVTNPVAEVARLTNSSGGLLLSITGPRQATYNVAYDGDGLVTQTLYPLGGGLSVSVTNQGTRILATAATPLGSTEMHELRLLTSGDTYRYNTFPDGTRVAEVLATSGAESISYDVDSYVNRDYISDPRFTFQTRQLANQTWILPGNLYSTMNVWRTATLSDLRDPFSIVTLSNQVTLNGRVSTSVFTRSNRVTVITSPEGRQVTTAVNEHGRPIRQQKSGQPPVDITYDTQGRLTQMTETTALGPQAVQFAYDSLGRLGAISDPLGRTNTFTYDGAGRLQQSRMPDGQTVGFTVDAENHLTSVSPPGRPAHQFGYNAVGLVTNYTPPQVSGADDSVHYTYDLDRNLTGVSLPDGQNLVLARAPGGIVQQVTLGSGPTLTYQYTNYNLLSRIVSSTGDGLSFGYQGMFLVTNLQWSGTITGAVTAQVNSDLLPVVQSVNGSPITNSYDRDTLMTRAGDLTLTRDPAHAGITATAIGGLTDQRQFDDRGLLTNYVARSAGTPIWSEAMSHDSVARLTNKVEITGGVTNAFGYVYDLAGRLQQVWQNGALSASYTYDVNGNRLSRNGESAAYDARDRVTSYNGTTFAWSPNGTQQTRTAGGQTTTYTYDVRGVLTGALLPGGQQITYILDPVGHRIGKTVAGVLQRGWLWSGFVPVAELGANSKVTAQFVFASRRNVPDYILKGTDKFRLLTDERGSVRFVVNVATGAVAQQISYDEFGRVLADTNPGFQPFGFAGGLYDVDTGLVHFGLREYSAETGQWTGRDPLGFAGGQTSLYAYVSNDPVNRTDPLGAGPFNLSVDELVGYGGNINDLVLSWGGGLWRGAGTAFGAVSGSLGAGLGGWQVGTSMVQLHEASKGNDQAEQGAAFWGLAANTTALLTPFALAGIEKAAYAAAPTLGASASTQMLGATGWRLGVVGGVMTTSVGLAVTSIGNAWQGKPTPIDIAVDYYGQIWFGLPSQIYGRDCP